mmetsp:Transcript_22258/g.28087  ORF Transcript_22258/g.28087 Transcript_22258/m.28087 type:complete len:213 (-) Transcript_22258:57-695(-)|eukprot:CAMPEP_0203669952 /NCGR_PEP_ID=MMETSP0090-20130426/6177_1 /ASSEMBLY_ACC=CAM_ASM_001088 /TAXON_ID=426623 /ORGANISM="Chaetoceros affinis, Strain CCMP159" /LENGTH=212 /DNA_ID=CAMNT_0050534719 /DNA_START=396 /DNA_END=1034 /DNA_ORIENTATION=+
MDNNITSSQSSTTSLSYENEIIQSFQIFDVERCGSISINNFKLILRALGFRVTKHDVLRDVLESNKRRGLYQQRGSDETDNVIRGGDSHNDFNDRMLKEIDLETVLDVILYNPDSKYNRMNQTEEEIKLMHRVNFRLFDVENKGYITSSNLKRAIQELKEFSKSLDTGSFDLNQSFDGMDDDELRAMIEEFDGDQDGMINESEFRKIMEFGL